MDAAIFQHITDPAGAPAVVFQHQVISLVIADQIGPANMNVNVLGHVEVHKLPPEMFARKNIKRRNNAVLQDFLFVINVVQEQVQRGDALDQAALDHFPFTCGMIRGSKSNGKNLFRPGRIPIHVERDALA